MNSLSLARRGLRLPNLQAYSPQSIKVLIPIAYDYRLSLRTIKLVYDHADMIQIAVDKNRKTWSGLDFVIPESYWQALRDFDTSNKIIIYEDNFFTEGEAPIVSETKQRLRMADYAGEGGWHIQLDADEYFIDFQRFVRFLRRCERHYGNQPIDIYVGFVSMFKHDVEGFFLAWPPNEVYPIATNNPDYRKCRSSHLRGRVCIKADSCILHDTWARDEASLAQKLHSWGHLDDFNVGSYLDFWRSVSTSNYRYIRDFHPIDPAAWPSLRYFRGELHDILRDVGEELDAISQTLLKSDRKYFILPPYAHLLVTRLKRLMSSVSGKLAQS